MLAALPLIFHGEERTEAHVFCFRRRRRRVKVHKRCADGLIVHSVKWQNLATVGLALDNDAHCARLRRRMRKGFFA